MKNLMTTMLRTIDLLKKKYLTPDGTLLFLFDNYTSREELKASLVPASSHQNRKKINPFYKANRKIASNEFYATLDLLHYYLKLKDDSYQSARISHLEADDLLPTAIEVVGNDKNFLLVSNDSDWCKALSYNVHILQDNHGEPFTLEDFKFKKGYNPSEESIKLEKLLYGDRIDNVKAVFTDFTPEEKKYILQRWDNVIDFLYEMQTDDFLSKYTILIKDKEKDIKLAYKMLSTIPVGVKQLKAVHIKGRSAKRMTDIIENIFLSENFGEAEKASFEFGNINIPRKLPVDVPHQSQYMAGWKKLSEEKEGLR